MKGNLLIVDDEEALSATMKELLEDEAHDIFTACNGREGLEILRKHKIDCVVSDIKMPVMDGLRLMKEARDQGHQVPFIFFTGHGTEDLKKQAQDMGADDLLTKPNFLLLESAVRKHLTA